MLNSLGLGSSVYWERLLGGSFGTAAIGSFDTTGYRCGMGAEIRGFDPGAFMPPAFYRRLSRLSRLAVAASIEAVRDSGMAVSDDNRSRIGSIFGTAFGSVCQTDLFFLSVLENGPSGAEPILFPDTVPNAPSSHVAMFHRLQGPNSTICQNHLSGECALAYAASLLDGGQADALLVGGVDELSPTLFHSLDAVRALKPCARSSTFHPAEIISGSGFIPGEGAACLVLERCDGSDRVGQEGRTLGILSALELANARAAQGHYTTGATALSEAIMTALEKAKLQPDRIDILGLAANGVKELEELEADALSRVFGEKWHAIPRIPVRYFLGEFGSAGLVSIATILLAVRDGIIPSHVQGEHLTGLPGNPRRFAPMRPADMNHGMILGATFGGGNSCTIVSRA